MKAGKLRYILVLVLVLLSIYSVDAQCAMCKEAAKSSLENDPNSIARGLNKGILLLMAIPYLILAVIFRKEIVQLVKTIRGKSKEPMNKNRLQKLTFALTFASVLIILFLLFLNVQSQR
jgi:amino acid permease